MRASLAALAVVLAIVGPAKAGHYLSGGAQGTQATDVPWPINGGIDNIRYSPLSQINRENVSKLQVAWTYDSHDAFKASEMQSNPVVVDGVLYVTTPTLKVVAVNAGTGKEIWKFDPSGGASPGARFRHRGVTVHKDRVFVSYRSFLYALDKNTGSPIAVVRHGWSNRPARGTGNARGKTERQRQHAGRRVRGSADHGQLGARDDTGIARAHSRVRREHRQASVDLPHHPSTRRVRVRHLVERRLQAVWWRERVGRCHGRREAGDGVCRHGIGVVRFLWGHALRRQSLRRLRPRARRAHRQARVAFSGHQARRLGLRFSRIAESRHRHAQRTQGGRRRADHQVRLRLCPEPADRGAAVSDRVAEGAAIGRRWRASVRAPALSGETSALHAAGSH